MQESLPYISVVVPAHNEAEKISGCVRSLLSQSYPRQLYEIIVVDNNSTDKTAELIRRHSVRYIFEKKQSSYAARNAGIEQARGEIIAFTDADCLADKDWLYLLVKGFGDEKIAGCGGKISGYPSENSLENYPGQNKVLSQEGALQNKELSAPFLLTANAMYRRDILAEAGYFDADFWCGGDADLAWRVQALGYEIKFVPEALVWHRHRNSLRALWKQMDRYGHGYVCLFKKYRKLWGRRFWIRWNDWLALGYFLCKCLLAWLFNPDKKEYAFYDLFCRTAILAGKIKGSFKYKVFVL